MENLNKDNPQNRQSINSPKKEGSFPKVIIFVGLIIILVPISRSFFEHQNQNNAQQKGNLLIKYTDKENKYSILYPSSWEILTEYLKNRYPKEIMENIQLLVAIGGEDGNLLIQVIKEKTKKNANVNTLFEQALANSPLVSVIFSKDTLHIDGFSAIKSVLIYTNPDGRPAKTMSLFLLRDIYLWKIFIGGNPEIFDANFSSIDSIANSFSFVK